MLDLKMVVYDQLVYSGISNNNIIVDNNCTHCNNNYFSFRRQGESAGRMVAVAGWY